MMSDLVFLLGVGGGFAGLGVAAYLRKRARDAAAEATGLSPAGLAHLPESLQRTALWKLADGGFESGGLAGTIYRSGLGIEVTAFELETLRDRRGEWAYLPVAKPFWLDGRIRVVVFRLPRAFPHVVLKRKGPADQLPDRTALERVINPAAGARVLLGQNEGVAAELPSTLRAATVDVVLPPDWRAYGDADLAQKLARDPLLPILADDGEEDQVIELLDDLVVMYQARSQRMRDLGDAGATPWPRMAQYMIDDGLEVVSAVVNLT